MASVHGTSRRIKVLWLIKGLGAGGAEQLLVSSARVADHESFDYSAAYVRPDKDALVPGLAAAGVPSTLLSAGSGGRWLWQLRLRPLMREADVVHAHSPLLSGVARLVALTLGRKRPVTVSTEHNVWGNFALPTRLLNALTCALDAQRWSVSGEVQRSMWGRMGRRAPVLVHGIVHDDGAQAKRPRSEVRSDLGIPDDAVVTVTVANLRKEKDYPNLLRAAHVALAQRDDLVMLSVGQGPLAEEMAALHAELGLGDRFKLLGYRSDVADLLGASDVFVLSSEFEGLPVSIMEAMAVGLPVVATTVGGVPEAVVDGETGRLVSPKDHVRLAEALVDLASDADARIRMGQEGRRRSTRFDIRNAVQTQQDAYRRLAAR